MLGLVAVGGLFLLINKVANSNNDVLTTNSQPIEKPQGKPGVVVKAATPPPPKIVPRRKKPEPLKYETKKPVRTWKSEAGQYSIEAKYVRLEPGVVFLEKSDGSEISVPFKSLSQADREYLVAEKRRSDVVEFLAPFERAAPPLPEFKLVNEFQLGADLLAIRPPTRLAVSADGGVFVYISHEKTGAYDLTNGKQLARFEGLANEKSLIAITPDGKLGVVSDNDFESPFKDTREPDKLYVWDLQTGKTVHTHQLPAPFKVIDQLKISPDGQHVVCKCNDGPYYVAPLKKSDDSVVAPPGLEMPPAVLSCFPPAIPGYPRSLNPHYADSNGQFAVFQLLKGVRAFEQPFADPYWVERITQCDEAREVKIVNDGNHVILARPDGRIAISETAYMQYEAILQIDSCDTQVVSADGRTIVQVRSRYRRHHTTPAQRNEFKMDPVVKVWKLTAWPKEHPSKDFAYGIHKMLMNKQFQKLESIAQYLAPVRTPFPWSRYATRYEEFFAAILSSPTPGKKRQSKPLIEMWYRLMQCDTVKLIVANQYYSIAWQARGQGYAHEVPPEAMRVFESNIAKAGNLVKQVVDGPNPPAIAYDRLFGVARSQAWDKAVIDRYVEKMMKRFPENYVSHAEITGRLMPRWGGKPRDSEAYAARIANKIGGAAGDVMYAKLADVVNEKVYFHELRERGFDIPRIVRGAEILYQEDPSNEDYIDLLMHYAYRSGDIKTCERLAKTVSESRMNYWDNTRWGEDVFRDVVRKIKTKR